MKSGFSQVTNEFPPVFDEHSKVLILGSLPSVASRQAGFYYMNPHNRFWKVLAILFGIPFPDLSKEQKIQALLSRGVALYDVIETCEIQSSSDASIKSAKCADLSNVLKRSEIRKILLNGQKAYSLFLSFHPELAPIAKRMPSTSPANAKVSLDELARIWGEELL